jgi:hypothetical protein
MITINVDKAKTVAHTIRRTAREKEFKPYDDIIMKRIPGNSYDDAEIAIALDTKTYSDKKALAKASESIQLILQNNKPKLWYGANRAFIKSIIDYASDKRATLGDKFDILVEYAMQHEQIAMANVQQEAQDQAQMINKQNLSAPNPEVPTAANPGVPGGMSRAMSVGNSV